MRAIVHKSQLEASGAGLAERFPYAPSHDDTNLIFPAIDPDAPHINVAQVMPPELTLDQQALFVAKLLAEPERVEHVWVDDNLTDVLFRHPAHRLWCGHYDDEIQRQEDWDALAIALNTRDDLSNQWPKYNPNLSTDQVRSIMLAAIKGSQ